ncbi:hypothetical protein ON010_g19130 [Phytophthora cinnamomi]|nr:hypothetical protein ON010_g19130 [Phytophthora cinnamomi]
MYPCGSRSGSPAPMRIWASERWQWQVKWRKEFATAEGLKISEDQRGSGRSGGGGSRSHVPMWIWIQIPYTGADPSLW